MTKQDKKAVLDKLRSAIDAVDDELLALIEKRAELAAQVGVHKEHQGDGPYYVPSREADIIRRLLAGSSGRIPEAALHGIFREIIGACLAMESPQTIAYLGPAGTFTHAASTRQFGSAARYLACKSLDEVFDEVESGRANYGVVPVENAFEGAVTSTLDLFADCEVSICAEVLLHIHHHLLTRAGRLEDVEEVLSHAQALAQCKKWLQANMSGASLREAESTASAAGALEDAGTTAAIASREIAKKLGLPILRENIEDHHDNTTRFLVIGQHDSPPSGDDKTALVMSIPDRPGALHALLEPFSRREIGLSRIESRPSRKKMWEYVFFVDLHGHRDDAAVAEALDEIRNMPGAYLKVLGSYPVSRRL